MNTLKIMKYAKYATLAMLLMCITVVDGASIYAKLSGFLQSAVHVIFTLKNIDCGQENRGTF